MLVALALIVICVACSTSAGRAMAREKVKPYGRIVGGTAAFVALLIALTGHG